MEGDKLFEIIDKYFWDEINHKYTCPESFLIELNEFREQEFALSKTSEVKK